MRETVKPIQFGRWKQVPRAVLLASGLLVLEACLLVATHAVSALSIGGLVVVTMIAVLLIRGSRVAWIFAGIVALGQCAGSSFSDQPMWMGVTAGVVLVALLSASSRQFIWANKRSPKRVGASTSPAEKYSWFVMLPVKADGVVDAIGRVANSRIIAYLAYALVPLFFAEVLLAAWHQGAGQGSLVVEVLWRISFAAVTLGLLALVTLLIIAGYRYGRAKLEHGSPGNDS